MKHTVCVKNTFTYNYRRGALTHAVRRPLSSGQREREGEALGLGHGSPRGLATSGSTGLS